MREIELGAAGENDLVLDLVGQFAGVARPALGEKPRSPGRRDGQTFQPMPPGDPLQQVPGQGQNIRAPFPQRWQLEMKQMQPVVQILPEFPGFDQVRQGLVGGGDETHIDANLLGRPEAPDRAILDRREHLGLGRGGQRPDFIQEQGATIGRLKQPDPGGLGVRKRAALMTEQLGLSQCFGKRRAVDGDEGTRTARSLPMDPADEKTLAGSGFAFDQDRWEALFEPPFRGDDRFEPIADLREARAEKEFVTGSGRLFAGAELIPAHAAAFLATPHEDQGQLVGRKRFR